ncbi:MAG TPA: DNA alkylation repair protein [Caulobacteraceae bacterium]|nr:DNA alkylation repair protein [Caulobacteraceae bacterium]
MTEALDIAAEHAALVGQLRAAGRPYRNPTGENDSYTGSGRPFFHVKAPELRAIARAWLTAHRGASDSDLLALVDALFAGAHHEEKTLAAVVLGYSARTRRAATTAKVDAWLDELTGWAEVDSLCAGAFTAAELAGDWPAWRALVERLSGDPNINRRRAALVLLTAPTRTSDDLRFRDLGFAVIERLKGERAILITKAVSWLLRSMAMRHAEAVAAYLDAESATLPAIAVRETRTKLLTGTKSGRSAMAR